MKARLYRISMITAVLAALAATPFIASPAQAAESEPATTTNGYTIGGAMRSFLGTNGKQQNDERSWFNNQLDHLSIVGGDSGGAIGGGPFAGYYSPRDSLAPLNLNDESLSGFTPRDSGMLGLVYAAEKWQLGAGYANSPAFDSGDPLNDRIDRYMLGTRYDAFGSMGFGASIELRDYNNSDSDNGPEEKVFTFGTYVNF